MRVFVWLAHENEHLSLNVGNVLERKTCMNNKKLMGRSTDGGPSTGSGRGRGRRSGNRPPGTVNQDFRPDDRISRMYRILAGGKSAAPLPIPNFFLCSCTFPVFLLGSRGERFQYPISNVQGDYGPPTSDLGFLCPLASGYGFQAPPGRFLTGAWTAGILGAREQVELDESNKHRRSRSRRRFPA